jgi:hypothetical protein
MNEWTWSTGGMILTGETEMLGGKFGTVPLCFKQLFVWNLKLLLHENDFLFLIWKSQAINFLRFELIVDILTF